MPISPYYAFLAYDAAVYHMPKRNGSMCQVSVADVRALNELVYMFSEDTIFLPPNTHHQDSIDPLRRVSANKPTEFMKVNLAVKSEGETAPDYRKFEVASNDEFASSGGLIHLEAVPPAIMSHLNSLKFRTNPRYIDTMTGAGLRRWAV